MPAPFICILLDRIHVCSQINQNHYLLVLYIFILYFDIFLQEINQMTYNMRFSNDEWKKEIFDPSAVYEDQISHQYMIPTSLNLSGFRKIKPDQKAKWQQFKKIQKDNVQMKQNKQQSLYIVDRKPLQQQNIQKTDMHIMNQTHSTQNNIKILTSFQSNRQVNQRQMQDTHERQMQKILKQINQNQSIPIYDLSKISSKKSLHRQDSVNFDQKSLQRMLEQQFKNINVEQVAEQSKLKISKIKTKNLYPQSQYQIKNYQGQLKKYQERIKDYENQIQIANDYHQLTRLKLKEKDQQLIQNENIIKQITEENEKLNHKISQYLNSISCLQQRLDNASEQNQELRKKLKNKSSLNDAFTSNKNIQNTISRMEKQIQTSTSSLKAKNQEIKLLQYSCRNFEEDIQKHKNKQAQSDSQLRKTINQNTNLKNTIQKMQVKIDQIMNLQQNLAQVRKQNKQITEQLQFKLSQISVLENQIAGYQLQKLLSFLLFAKFQNQILTFKNQNQFLQNKIVELISLTQKLIAIKIKAQK